MFRVIVEVANAKSEKHATSIVRTLLANGDSLSSVSETYWYSRVKGFQRTLAGLAVNSKREWTPSEYATQIDNITTALTKLRNRILNGQRS